MSIRDLWVVKKRPVRAVYLALLMLLIASLACALPFSQKPTPTVPGATSTPTTPPKPTATPLPLPPGLVESDPPLNSELPLEGPITLFFNQPMDRDSVEAALTGQMQQQLTFNWVDDSTVIVYLSDPLSPETAYAFNLDPSIRSRQGLSLTQRISLNYRTAGFLRLVQFLPENGAVDVDPSGAIVAAFNRPVVPLGADPAGLPAAFSLEPAASGRGQWLNTSTYIFYPEPALAGGKTYIVKMNPDLKSTDGSPLQDAADWSFTTALPELLSVEPSTETPWPLDAQVVLTFNQPMDQSSVAANFSLTGPGGAPVTGQIEWDDASTVLTFKPEALLPRDTQFTLSLSAQAQASGGTPLSDTFSTTVITVPELAVTNTEPVQGGSVDPNAGVALYFSSPLEDKDLKSYFTVVPSLPYQEISLDGSAVRLWGGFAPDTDYQIKVSPSLADRWGDTLGQEYILAFRTNPLSPNVSILASTDAIFLTPQDISLIVQAVNISEIPLTVGSVPLEDLFVLLGPQGYELRQNYQSLNQSSWVQPLEQQSNQNQNVPVYLSEDRNALTPGIYFVRLDFPQSDDPSQMSIYPGPYIVVVSNVQLTFKISATDTLVWAVDLRSGALLPDAPITLYKEDGSVLTSGQTDSEGVFRANVGPIVDPYSPVYAVMGQPGQDSFGMAFSNWYTGVEPWDFGIDFRTRPPGLQVYLYSDRPIYRPGQTVYFRAVARNAYNGRYTPPDISSLPLKIYGAEGRELASLDLPLTAYGAAHGQFDLPSDAQPGYYSINAPDVPDTYLGFQVASYRKPEINLEVSLSADQLLAGEKLSASINARYFFDAPAGDLPLRWALYAARSSFSLPGYQVGPESLDWLEAYLFPSFSPPLGELVSEGQARTSADGTLSLEFPTELKDTRQRYTLEVTVEDETGLPVSARDSAEVNPADYYIGLRPDAWAVTAGQAAGFEVQTVDWDQNPSPDRRLRADFQKVVFERQDPPSGSDPYQMPRFVPRYTSVASTDFVTGSDGKARLAFTPPDPGTYMLDVFDPQLPQGQGTRTQILLWVGGAGQAVWPNLPNSRLRLTSDRDSYKPGDTAQIFIPNPYGAQIQALLTLERSIVMRHEVLQIGPEGYNLVLPLTDEEAPNIVLSVTLLGRDSRGNPDFRQGYLNLPVQPVQQELKVTLLSQPERAGPGDQVQFDLLVTDSAGVPVQGEFSLAAVDLAVLALAEPNSVDILQAFYGEQPVGVRTSQTLAVYNRRMLNLPVGAGGGGGGEAPSVVRESFPDTAYWNAEIVTGSDGKATVTTTLPDSLTTWQLDTRGLTLDTRVGQSQAQVVTTKELLVRPVTPRFFVANDHALLAAVLQNNSNADLQVQAALQANGFVLDDPAQQSQSVNLPAGGRARLEWWGVAQDASEVDLVFSAEGRDAAGAVYTDAARPNLGKLPVLRYYAPQTFRTAGILETADEVKELVSLPRSYEPSSGGLEIELSPTVGAAMLRALETLEDEPFASTEQIVSSFLPNLETFRTMQQFNIQDASLKTSLDQALNEGLQRLLARQGYDGGWAWWQGGQSEPYITSYALFGLVRARQAGIAINQTVIEQAVAYLQGAAPGSSQGESSVKQPTETWEWDRLVFQQFALAQLASADAGQIDQIYQSRQQLSPWSQALLAWTMEKMALDDEQVRTLYSDLQSSALRSATGAYWEFSQDEAGRKAAGYNMHTNLSNSAIVLYTLAQRDPGSPLVADAARFLMANRDAEGAWATTYATAWSLIAMNEVLKGTSELGGDFNFSASVNNNLVAEGRSGGADQLTPVMAQVPIQRLYPDYPNVLSIQRDGAQGRLYYTAGLTVSRPVEEVTPLSDGLTVERGYFPHGEACAKDEAACSPIQAARAGEKVSVRLTLTLPHDMYYLAVTDYIPAGAEILDTSLKTSQVGQEGEGPVEVLYDPRDPFKAGWGWWLFSQPQIYDDHIAWTADYLPAGVYQLNYTLVLLQPGQYRALPSRAWQLYFPEVQANSAGSVFEIQP